MNVSSGMCMYMYVHSRVSNRLTFAIFFSYSAYYYYVIFIIIIAIVIIRKLLLLNLEFISLSRLPMQ